MSGRVECSDLMLRFAAAWALLELLICCGAIAALEALR